MSAACCHQLRHWTFRSERVRGRMKLRIIAVEACSLCGARAGPENESTRRARSGGEAEQETTLRANSPSAAPTRQTFPAKSGRRS